MVFLVLAILFRFVRFGCFGGFVSVVSAVSQSAVCSLQSAVCVSTRPMYCIGVVKKSCCISENEWIIIIYELTFSS